jgi:hypothetical protein
MLKGLLVALVGVAIAGLALFAGLASASPGPNGHNDYGLCKAYSAGSDNGQAHKHKAGPFVALEDAAGCTTNSDGTRSCDCGDPNGDGSPDTAGECVANFCSSVTPGGK